MIIKSYLTYDTSKVSEKYVQDFLDTVAEQGVLAEYDSEKQQIKVNNEEADYDYNLLGIYMSENIKHFIAPDTDMVFKSMSFAFNKKHDTLTVRIKGQLLDLPMIEGQI